jgi:hypothetical protein
MTAHAQLHRDDMQTLRGLGGNLVQGTTATRARRVRRLNTDLLALQMPGQVTQQTLGRHTALALRLPRGARGGVLAGRRDGREVLLDIVQSQLELVGIETLGLWAGLGSLELLQELIQSLTIGFRFFISRLEVIALRG